MDLRRRHEKAAARAETAPRDVVAAFLDAHAADGAGVALASIAGAALLPLVVEGLSPVGAGATTAWALWCAQRLLRP